MLKLALQRTVAYIDRLPLFSRLVIVLAVAAEVLRVLPWWDVRAWGRLEPDALGLATMYRTNTFPFIHTDVVHLVVNLLGVTPMMERFEGEMGTLGAVALFFGRECRRVDVGGEGADGE
jgi:glycosylphosphatidylinositol transamidase